MTPPRNNPSSSSPPDPTQLGLSRVGTAIPAGQLRRWRQEAREQAIEQRLDPIEVDWLLQQLAQVDKLSLRLAPEGESLPLGCSFDHLDQIWQRRQRERLPLQYLVGHAPWRNFELVVGPGVLIPRPETELLIELVQVQVNHQSPERRAALRQGPWADLGTGSGAIALGLAEVFPEAKIHAVDCSPEALAIAQRNIDRYRETHALAHRLQLHQGEWFTPLTAVKGQLQGMLSNPPYIPTADLATLQREVQHEPSLALDGGEDGLDCLRHLTDAGAEFLVSGGFWAVELMAGQAPAVEALLQSHGSYGLTGRTTDLAGIERFVWGYRR